jgi:hypothetical protein
MIQTPRSLQVASPNGFTIRHCIGSLILKQVLAKPGSEFDGPKFEYLGVSVQLISGYKGTADIRLAIAAGELHVVSHSKVVIRVYRLEKPIVERLKEFLLKCDNRSLQLTTVKASVRDPLPLPPPS